jgi:hypothetical protein
LAKVLVKCLVEIEVEKDDLPSKDMSKKEIIEYFSTCINGQFLGNIDIIYPVTSKLRKDSERF